MKTKLHSSKIKILGILIILSVFTAIGARAQEIDWVTANQYSVTWDAVTTKTDGALLGTTDIIEYEVLTVVYSEASTDRSAAAAIWRGRELSTIVTLTVEGDYLVGVRAYRLLAAGTEVGRSSITWSDDATANTTPSWGIRFYLGPANVKNISKAIVTQP